MHQFFGLPDHSMKIFQKSDFIITSMKRSILLTQLGKDLAKTLLSFSIIDGKNSFDWIVA
ncbi:hypothetical protein L873DRAFT_123697 [Choiromyces venosus 120613-1]|uniref:Uncharacterized protein n=1 Tax=Choiromyces venosus 120613-1 TaxID=1336337 RepID=A0A3N4J3H0_9PEZI|nr:hypothetical protein L873DRAFT_123697 [Choiromyces venosus 120613-1]